MREDVGMFEICLDRRDDDARLDGHQVDAHQRDAHPCVDDDAFVEHAVEDIDEVPAAGRRVNQHNVAHALALGMRRAARRAGVSENASSLRPSRQVFRRPSAGRRVIFCSQQYFCHQLFQPVTVRRFG